MCMCGNMCDVRSAMCAMLRCPTMRSSDAKRIQTDTPSNEQMARELCCCPCVYAHTLPAVANNTQGTRECVWMCVVDVAMSATLLPHRGGPKDLLPASGRKGALPHRLRLLCLIYSDECTEQHTPPFPPHCPRRLAVGVLHLCVD